MFLPLLDKVVDSWFGKGSGFCYTLTLDMLNHVDTENNDNDNGLYSINQGPRRGSKSWENILHTLVNY